MRDANLCKRIARAARVTPKDTVLEIGPGHGELTKHLLTAKQVVAVEQDPQLVEATRSLRARNLQVVRGNALRELKSRSFSKIISNLPYSLCEPLFNLLPCLSFTLGVFTLPVRFASRLHHPPYSLWFSSEELFPIPKGAFSPQPRTASVVVRVTPRSTFLGAVLLRRTSKLKNALRDELRHRGISKREATETVSKLSLGSKENMPVQLLTPSDVRWLAEHTQHLNNDAHNSQ